MPGLIVSPPRFGKQKGLVVTSIRRTGSQKPKESPGRIPHRQTGRLGLDGSGLSLGQRSKPPIESGKKQSQQMSVMGLGKWPWQVGEPCACATCAEPIARLAATMAQNRRARRSRGAPLPDRSPRPKRFQNTGRMRFIGVLLSGQAPLRGCRDGRPAGRAALGCGRCRTCPSARPSDRNRTAAGSPS